MNENIITRQMLRAIREAEETQEQKLIDASEDDFDSELKKLIDINNSAKITSFKLYPKDGNVVMTGSFPNLGEFNWQMDLSKNDSIFLTTSSLELNDDAVTVIAKLRGYYKTWSKEWAEKIREEY